MDKKPIPELPKDLQELWILANKNFRTVSQDKSVSVLVGAERKISIVRECPFCLAQFPASKIIVSFGSLIAPSTCPNCDFPRNVIRIIRGKFGRQKNKPRSA